MTATTARRPLLALLAITACGGPVHAPPLDPVGGSRDEGTGLLAQASMKLLTGAGDDDASAQVPRRYRGTTGAYGGGMYGGGLYGGSVYGGLPPAWNYNSANRAPHYVVRDDLHGVIEGVVSWSGAAPARVTTRCGVIDDPAVRVGAGGGVGGVVVYIAHVDVGRPVQTFGRSPTVGGVVVKHGCALYPAAQVVAPVPAPIVINGDGTRTQVQITTPAGDRSQLELQEGGLVRVEAMPGVTRVEGVDGALGAAWVIAVETPYYAVTDDAGQFRIDQLAPGNYDLTIWQAPLAHATDGVITYATPVVVHRAIKIELGKPTKLAVTLPPR